MFSYEPLAALLKERGYSLEGLQNLIGYNMQMKSRLNNGAYISMETLDKICSAFGVTVDRVIEWKPGKQPVFDNSKTYLMNWDELLRRMNEAGVSMYRISLDSRMSTNYLNQARRSNNRVSERVMKVILSKLNCKVEDITIKGQVMKRYCNYCGKTFEAVSFEKRYCSDRCSDASAMQFGITRHDGFTIKIINCYVCDKEFFSVNGNKYCCKECEDEDQIITPRSDPNIYQEYIAVNNRVDDKVSKRDFLKLFTKMKCSYCGCNIEFSTPNQKGNLTIDHIIPVSKGGLNNNNLTLACSACNISKRTKSESDYRKYLKENPEVQKERFINGNKIADKIREENKLRESLLKKRDKEKQERGELF